MPIKQTSVDAYRAGKVKLGEQANKILTHMEDGRARCIAVVARELGMEKSSVSARMNELRAMRLIVSDGKRVNGTTGFRSEYWKAVEPRGEGQLF